MDTVLQAATAVARKATPIGRQVDADVAQQRTEALLCNANSSSEFLTPSGLSLLAHQRDGVRWLLAMHRHQQSAVVADEMGLGKTIEVLAFFSALARHGCFGTFLVVAPLTTLDNWAGEAQTWAPFLHVTRFTGSGAQRQKLRAALRRRHRNAFAQAERLRALWQQPSVPSFSSSGKGNLGLEERVKTVGGALGGLVLASYEAVMADKGALARLLPWDVVVVDEAQRLKRMDCELLRHLRKAQGAMRVILSGTPVQNNARELWTLMEYVAPGCFGDGTATAGDTAKQQQQRVHAALDAWVLARGKRKRTAEGTASGSKRRRLEADESDMGEEEEELSADFQPCETQEDNMMQCVVEQLHKALKPFLLRRTKASAGIALPTKVQLIVPTPLTPLQQTVYAAVETADTFLNNRQVHQRRCCLYAGSLLEQLAASPSATVVSSTALRKALAVIARNGPDRFALLSSKLEALAHLLPALHAQGHRVLLFSQFTSALDVLEDFLAETLPTLSYARLDGATAAADRVTGTAQFQATPTKNKQTMREAGFQGNVENGIRDDDFIFETPPPKPSQALEKAVLAPRRENVLYEPKHGKLSCFGAKFPLPLSPQQTQPNVCEPITDGAQPVLEATSEGKTFLYLISTRTGGTGLNLTGADTVLLFDGDFNPHNDRQAIDRCHRIGQRRPVVVYRLVCPATVEGHQLAIAQRKLSLEKAVLGDAERRSELGSDDSNIRDVTAELSGTDEEKLLFRKMGDANVDGSQGNLSASQLTRLADHTWLFRQFQ